MIKQDWHEVESEQEFVDATDYRFFEQETAQVQHRRDMRKLLERKLEERRLRNNIDELDGEFEWDDLSNKS
jgi:hypothetical protein